MTSLILYPKTTYIFNPNISNTRPTHIFIVFSLLILRHGDNTWPTGTKNSNDHKIIYFLIFKITAL